MTTAAPSWAPCGQGAAPGDPLAGCTGITVTASSRCLAHADAAEQAAYLASLSPGADLDLRGTTISEPLLSRILNAMTDPATQQPAIGTAQFGSATFTGTARFTSATFTRDARFESATFTGDAGFGSATFTGTAGFGSATFTGKAGFGSAAFNKDAHFDSATFSKIAYFDSATFSRDALTRAAFRGDALFTSALFEGTSVLTSTRFEKSLRVVINSVIFRSSGQDLTTTGTYTEMTSRLTEPVLLGLALLAVRGRIKR